MKTMLIRNGDLALGEGGWEMVTGSARVQQDLGVALREPIGVDRFHPGWGTILSDLVGGIIDADVRSEVESEINRVINLYSAQQAEIIDIDVAAGETSRLRPSEIISDQQNLEVRQVEDRLAVRVTLTMLGGQTVQVVRQVAA